MRIKMLKAEVFNGSVWPVGSTPDLPEEQAQALIEQGRAVEFKETRPAWDLPSAEIPAPATEPKEKKKA